VTAAELASQAAAGVAKVDTEISAVVEIFDDAVENPEQAGANLSGALAGVPFLMKDLGPTMKGRLQEMGSLLMRGNRADADIGFEVLVSENWAFAPCRRLRGCRRERDFCGRRQAPQTCLRDETYAQRHTSRPRRSRKTGRKWAFPQAGLPRRVLVD
jgi:hypothetical protein